MLMQQKDALIDIFDEAGKNVGHKFRSEVNKRKDILKAVNIVLVDDQNKIFVVKASKDSIFPGMWGTSAAGLVRHDESNLDAAKRTLKRELGITAELTDLGQNFYDFNGVKRFMSVFYAKTKAQPKVNPSDAEEGKWATIKEVEQMIEKGVCMPTLDVAVKQLKGVIK